MGCDIHTFVERRIGGRWEIIRPLDNELFGERRYGVFGFLANVRNYSAIPGIAEPRGLPADVSDFVRKIYEAPGACYHSPSWLFASELSGFDYDQQFEDRRVKRPDGGDDATCSPGEGRKTSYRAFLGPPFFASLERLKESGAERLVFFFDS